MSARARTLALALIVVACGHADLESVKPKRLIDDLWSKSSQQEVKAALGSNAQGWRVHYSGQSTPQALGRAVEYERVAIPHYTSIGFRGRLRLEFEDGMLVRAELFPREFADYVSALSNELGLSLLESPGLGSNPVMARTFGSIRTTLRRKWSVGSTRNWPKSSESTIEPLAGLGEVHRPLSTVQ